MARLKQQSSAYSNLFNDTANLDYKHFFNSLATPFLAFAPDDPTFTIVAENQAHASISLADPATAIGKPVFDVFPDTSEKYLTTGVSDFRESLRKVVKTGKPDIMPALKYDVPGPDGKFVVKWWRLAHYPVYNEDGSLLLICQATEDITERMLSEQKLQLAKSQLDSALEIGLVSTWSWNIKTDRVTGDRNLARRFILKSSMTPADLIGMIQEV